MVGDALAAGAVKIVEISIKNVVIEQEAGVKRRRGAAIRGGCGGHGNLESDKYNRNII